ncbi:MAG: TetR/AcrR family transcriptional regulator [Acidimicrobiales bacterium]
MTQEPSRNNPRQPGALDRDKIVEVALAIVDHQGLQGLTMRNLARELAVTAGALYLHLGSKEHLHQLLVDRVIGEIDLKVIRGESWQEIVVATAFEMKRVLSQHRDLVQLIFGRIPVGNNFANLLEELLARLLEEGLSPYFALYIGDLLAQYVGVTVYEEQLKKFSSDPTLADGGVEVFFTFLERLDRQRYPTVHRVIKGLSRTDNTDRFALGLEIIVQGIERLENQPGNQSL